MIGVQDSVTGKNSLPLAENSVLMVKAVATTTTTSRYNSAATTNATSVDASPAKLFSVVASNVTGSTKYLKLYNKASAPTVGTDTPFLVIPIPATSGVSQQYGIYGMYFDTGLAFAITGGAADSDTTAVAVGDVKVVLNYL